MNQILQEKRNNINDISSSNEFMLEEYRQLYEERRSATVFVEQRVNFFFSIVSAFAGALVVLTQISTISPNSVYNLTQLGLIILLLYGLYIFHRVVSRDIRHRTILLLLREIMEYFSSQDVKVAKFAETREKIYSGRKHKSKLLSIVLKRIRGGLIDLIILSDSLICGGIIYSWQIHLTNNFTFAIIWAGVTLVSGLLFLYSYYQLLQKLY